MTTPSAAPEIEPQARRREQRGWYFYDWANSAFSTTVAAVFLGPYLTALTESAAGVGGFVHLLGIPIRAGSFFPYILSLSVVLQVLLLPITGAVADRTQRKKQLLALFAYIGAVATMGLYLLRARHTYSAACFSSLLTLHLALRLSSTTPSCRRSRSLTSATAPPPAAGL